MAALADPEEIRAHLIGAAAAGTPLTYSELLERLGYPFSRPRMRQLCALLGEVDSIGGALGEPELAVLVVRQPDGLPGQGWWLGVAERYGYKGPWEGPRAKRFIAKRQALSFDFWASRAGTVPARDGD
jgi:hypothetical protein